MKRNRFPVNLQGFIPVVLLSAGTLMVSPQKPSRLGPPEKEGSNDKTLSPYFFVKSDDPLLDQLPLKATTAEVNIAGVIADVTVIQEYSNEGKRPIEAVYTFPASTRAAVYSMKMTIGERTVVAKIAEREQARKDYEEAKQQGKSASLLEEDRPNVFRMNVANIMPGDRIVVEMKYTELLVPEDGIYHFIYPTVVGPRYSNKNASSASQDDKWVSNPYLHQGEKPAYSFRLDCTLNAGMPVSEISCPTHKAIISFENTHKAVITLDDSEKNGGNRDFILNYSLKGQNIQSGLLMYEGKDENFFLAILQPPKKITTKAIPPREYVFIVDVSGSMYGYPLEISKNLLRSLVGNLRPYDRFNVILFAGCSNLFAPQSVEASPENLQDAIAFIEKEKGSGGTELLPALKRALALPTPKDYARTFVIATDGYVDVEREAFDLIRNNLDKANFFSFGIGTAVNRYLIEGMAHAGSGMPFIVTKQEDASGEADRFRNYISNPVLTHIKLRFNGLQVYDVEPLSIPDVLAERPVLIFGKYRGNPSGEITISGYSGSGEYNYKLDVSEHSVSAKNAALRQLWARERIRNLDDFGGTSNEDGRKTEIKSLGLKYSLLTRFTSFVAIDSQVRNSDGKTTTVEQPLPLPDGVSDYAVGGVQTASCAMPRQSYKALGGYNVVSGIAVEAKESEERVFLITESSPEFPGGEKAMKAFIAKNLAYPKTAREKGLSGKVYLSVTVNADGSLSVIKVRRGIGMGCDEEAIRVVKLMPKWKPGMQNGVPVKTKVNIIVEFRLK